MISSCSPGELKHVRGVDSTVPLFLMKTLAKADGFLEKLQWPRIRNQGEPSRRTSAVIKLQEVWAPSSFEDIPHDDDIYHTRDRYQVVVRESSVAPLKQLP